MRRAASFAIEIGSMAQTSNVDCARWGIRDKPIALASPWQNGIAERLIGSIRRECMDHFIVLGEAHLRRILRAYARYYNDIRTNRALDKDAPVSRPSSADWTHYLLRNPWRASSPLCPLLLFRYTQAVKESAVTLRHRSASAPSRAQCRSEAASSEGADAYGEAGSWPIRSPASARRETST